MLVRFRGRCVLGLMLSWGWELGFRREFVAQQNNIGGYTACPCCSKVLSRA